MTRWHVCNPQITQRKKTAAMRDHRGGKQDRLSVWISFQIFNFFNEYKFLNLAFLCVVFSRRENHRQHREDVRGKASGGCNREQAFQDLLCRV